LTLQEHNACAAPVSDSNVWEIAGPTDGQELAIVIAYALKQWELVIAVVL
jgi:hypothetical protein